MESLSTKAGQTLLWLILKSRNIHLMVEKLPSAYPNDPAYLYYNSIST